jgi:hypothetical protein
VGLLDNGRRLGTQYKDADKICLKTAQKLFVDAYPRTQPGCELFEVVCEKSGKYLMPPVLIRLYTSS